MRLFRDFLATFTSTIARKNIVGAQHSASRDIRFLRLPSAGFHSPITTSLGFSGQEPMFLVVTENFPKLPYRLVTFYMGN